MVASTSALAGAFSHAVAAAEPPGTSSADEWYVGINGVPVGPMRLSSLRAKAAMGAVTKDSLVWRDGFEEWKPLSTFPELVAIVEESLSSARASIAPLPPPEAKATAESRGDAPTLAPVAAVAVGDPFAAPARGVSAGSVTGAAVVTESTADLEMLAAVRPRKTPMAAWIAVAVALLFGLTIGFVVFGGQKETKTVVKIVEKPVETPAQAAPAITAEPVPQPIDETNVEANKGAKGGPAKTPRPAEPGGKPLSGLSGLSGLQGTGPQTGPALPGAGGPAGGGQGLDGSAVQQTVSRYTSSVKRRCWQPALDARAKDAPTSARVSATITVGPSGSVQNVTSSGDPKGYRGLSSCITSSIRAWQFPASGGTTTVNVPFVFAAQ